MQVEEEVVQVMEFKLEEQVVVEQDNIQEEPLLQVRIIQVVVEEQVLIVEVVKQVVQESLLY